MKKEKDLVGKRFGKLVVLCATKIKDKHLHGIMWECICDCGNITTSNTSLLQCGRKKSCGCQRKSKGTKNSTNKDLTNKRFYNLVAKKIIGKNYKGVIWECECDCGNITQTTATKLRVGLKKSCGCRKHGKNHYMWSGHENILGSFWTHIRNHANSRNLVFNVSIKEAADLFKHQNERCAISGVKLSLPKNTEEYISRLHTASFDRIDSSKGYIKGNVQWIHKILNAIKLDMDQDDFINWCIKIAKNNTNFTYLKLNNKRKIWSARKHQNSPAVHGQNIKISNKKVKVKSKNKDLTEQRFGKLVAKKIIGKNCYGNIWECKCDCGNTTSCVATLLRLGRKNSCGCGNRGKNHYMWTGYEDITGFFWGNIKSGAVERKLNLDITIQEAWHLFKKQNGRCAISGVQLCFPKNTKELLEHKQTASLDRIDSIDGYVQGNIQWVHKTVNIMKMDMEQDNFIAWCIEIANYNKNKITNPNYL
jgi:hypothetical protein